MTNQAITQSPSASFVEIKAPEVSDAAEMYKIAFSTGLDVNSPYSYLMMCQYFQDTCAVASVADIVAGFVTGFRLPQNPEELFIWQIGVAPGIRGRGVASELLNHLVERTRPRGVRYLQATINPSNRASIQTFKSLAERLECEVSSEQLFNSSQFPANSHEDEDRYRIGPF